MIFFNTRQRTCLNLIQFLFLAITCKKRALLAEIELSLYISRRIRIYKSRIAAGMDIDIFAPRLSFFLGDRYGSFYRNCKIKSCKNVWAKIVKQFNPKNQKSFALRTHCQTVGGVLTEQDPFNNVARTALKLCAAVWWHQVLHTNALMRPLHYPQTLVLVLQETHKFICKKKPISQKQLILGLVAIM